MNEMRKLMEAVEQLDETSSEQYEVMLDLAGELGDMIAADNILDDHTNAWSQGLDRLSPEEITINVDKHIGMKSLCVEFKKSHVTQTQSM